MSRASRGVTSDRPENQKKRREGTAMESIAIDRSKAETLNRGPFLPPVERPKGLMMKLAYYFTRRQFGATADRLRSVLRKNRPTGQETHPPGGDRHADSRASSADQCLSFLHRYWAVVYDQGFDESS